MIGGLIKAAGAIIGGKKAQNAANDAAQYQLDLANKQMEESIRLRQEALDTRVDYKTPQEIEMMLSNARREAAASEGIVQGVVEQSDRMAANQVGNIQRSATSGAQALAAINATSTQGLDALQQAQLTEAQLNKQDQAALASAQRYAAGYRDKEYEKNIQQEFDRLYGESQDLRGASMQNEAMSQALKVQGAAAMGQAIATGAEGLGNFADSATALFNPAGMLGSVQGQMFKG